MKKLNAEQSGLGQAMNYSELYITRLLSAKLIYSNLLGSKMR